MACFVNIYVFIHTLHALVSYVLCTRKTTVPIHKLSVCNDVRAPSVETPGRSAFFNTLVPVRAKIK